MKKIIVPFLLGVAVSFYLFPVSFTFLPHSLNTKMMLALIGAFLFLLRSLKSRQLSFSGIVFGSAAWAALFSGCCYLSVYLNNTSDMTYVTYIESFFVWLAGAYAIYRILQTRYEIVNISVLTKYLMWVCVAQCISALLIDNVPSFKALVNSIFWGSQFVESIGRMYGIGAALDPAGVRFSISLVLISYDLVKRVFIRGSVWNIIIYIFGFFFIVLIGNMISRTTTVGMAMGLAFILISLGKLKNGELKYSSIRAVFIILTFLVVAVPVVVYLYNTSSEMHSNLRFAFEGFFNWAETGEWRTDSTDKLNSVMWIWPSDMRTWIIGSGLIDNYVYSTDIGYCRFVLYCGIVGFSVFCFFFIYNAKAVYGKFESSGWLALMLLALTFIIWIKVSTDIFQIYALLFCIDAIENDDNEPIVEEIPEEDDLDKKLARWAEDYARK